MKQYFKNTWEGIWTVLVGMRITFKHLFAPNVTIQYPEVKIDLPDRSRNRLYVNIDDCIGCDQCARACPVSCITIETVKGVPGEDLGKTSNGKKKALWVTQFDIDIAKCCFCSLCVYPCPTECIKMTDVYEFSEYERSNLLYNFSTMKPEEVAEKKANYAKAEAEKAAQKAAAAAAPKVKAEAAEGDKPKAAPAAPKAAPAVKAEVPKTEAAPAAESAADIAKPEAPKAEPAKTEPQAAEAPKDDQQKLN